MATRTEERMALAMSYVRCATGVLVLVPLLRWRLLERPALAVIADAAVIVESLWVLRRTRRGRTLLDPVLAVSDAAFAGLLALTVSRTVGPAQRDSQLIEVVSFALASAGFAGFGLGVSVAGVAVVVGLAGAWALAVWPDVTVKLVSDVLGFLLWFAVCVLVGREFRAMAALADDAQARSAALQVEMVERRRETDIARERELMHREIHEHLLPIVDAVAAGRGEEARLGALARREAQRARLLLVDGRVAPPGGLAALLADVRDTYVEAGLPLTAVFRLAAEPPPDVAEAVATAAREALSNVLKHAGSGGDVTLFAQADEDGLEIVVRDHGRGFAPGSVPAGGSLVTYAAVRRRGGSVAVDSAPGTGTKVTVRWPAPAPPAGAGPPRPRAADVAHRWDGTEEDDAR